MDAQDARFRWTQLVITTIFGGLLTVGGTIYLKRMDAQVENAKIAQEKERIAQAEREFQVRQKDTEVELTAKMFGLLMERYLKEDAVPARMLTLRLLALNFSDVPINLRPIFQDLERRLNPSEKLQLQDVAREVARRQAFRLATINGGGRQDFQGVSKGDEAPLLNTPFRVHVTSIHDDTVEVELIEGDRAIGPFKITYYDWPLVDNTKFGNLRIAAMLLATKGDKASLRLIYFPSGLAPDRIDLKEAGRERSATYH